MNKIVLGRINVRSTLTSGQHPQAQQRRQAKTHRHIFSSLVAALKEYEVTYESDLKNADDGLKKEADRLAHHSLITCDLNSNYVAIDRENRWISILVQDEEPKQAASRVQSFLRDAAKGIDLEGASIEVDLSCPPDTVRAALRDLRPILQLQLTTRLPNDAYDWLAFRQAQLSHNAKVVQIKAESDQEIGMQISSRESHEISREVALGNADVMVHSANGGEFDSREEPTEYHPTFEIGRAVFTLALAVAVVWWIETYFPGGVS